MLLQWREREIPDSPGVEEIHVFPTTRVSIMYSSLIMSFKYLIFVQISGNVLGWLESMNMHWRLGLLGDGMRPPSVDCSQQDTVTSCLSHVLVSHRESVPADEIHTPGETSGHVWTHCGPPCPHRLFDRSNRLHLASLHSGQRGGAYERSVSTSELFCQRRRCDPRSVPPSLRSREPGCISCHGPAAEHRSSDSDKGWRCGRSCLSAVRARESNPLHVAR